MKSTPEQIEAELTDWRETESARIDRRDQMVRRALAAGFNINKIHTLSGISRPAIYRIQDKGGTL